MGTPIPLLQYWHDGSPPPAVRRRMDGWAGDPDFEVSVHDDASAADFLGEHFDRATLRAFDSCAVPAMRADFFRYAWLHVYGGAYVDADVTNLGGAGEVFRATDRGCLFLRQVDKPPKGDGWRPGRIPNGIVYLRNPGDPAMAYALERATENIARRVSNDVWEVTGPGILTAVWGQGGTRSEEFFAGFTIHSFEEVAEQVGEFGHMGFKNRDTYWRKYRDPSHGSIFRTPVDGLPTGALLLSPGSSLLHIGPPKTGSTAIQVSLQKARRDLADHGVKYVGINRARRASWSMGLGGAPASQPRPPEQVWDKLVDDVRGAGAQRVCISNEDFGRAEPDQIRRIVDGLGGEEPHVVAVVRRLDKLLPSLWQQRVKVGSPLSYDDWLQIVLDRPERSTTGQVTGQGAPSKEEAERTNVWYAHDTASVGRWVDVVGADRVTLLISDDRDRHLLPRTFERMLGLPPNLLALHPDQANQSLPWSQVEFVRAINEALIARGLPPAKRRRLVSRGLVPDLMARPVPTESRRTPPFPEWAAARVRELSETQVDEIHALGVRVVGDTESLRVTDVATGDTTEPPGVPATAAARAIDWLVGELLTDTDDRPERPRPAAPDARRSRRRGLLRRR